MFKRRKSGYKKKSIWKKIKQKLFRFSYQRQLDKILAAHAGKPIMVLLATIDFNSPIYQRPEHIALNLAKTGFLYFYCTRNLVNDDVDGFMEIAPNCYLTDLPELLLELQQQKIIHIYSTDPLDRTEIIRQSLTRQDRIVYEYIDEIHESISGQIPAHVLARHETILRDERCYVVATADKLLADVAAKRSRNFALVTNGVDNSHFRQQFSQDKMPDLIKRIKNRGEKIVGYFGSLACWFDYQLVIDVALARPECHFLLIGYDYDGSMKKFNLERYANITVSPPIPYKELPAYGSWFDVSCIPFLINDITLSTSPVKLFEYMAMGKPIVTTAMPECKKYASVLTAASTGDFICQLDKAVILTGNKAYLEIMEQEAHQNDWLRKAEEIKQLLFPSNSKTK